MAKLHRKQSKRMTGRMKYKIIHKVAEHKRKVRREQKKNPKHRKPKDPGVPNSLPFKDEILREAEQRKQRAKDLKEAQKASRSKLQMDKRGLGEMIATATQNDNEFERGVRTADENGLKENATNYKSYFKDLKKVVEAADVVLEVLDARDPLGSRCPQIEELVISSGKKLVLVLNKIDLIPRNNLDEWLKYLRQSLPTVAFKACTQTQNTNLSVSKVAATHITESLQSSSQCVGATFLMKVLGNYCRNQNIQTCIKVGVVGFPNVGKSSVINSLKRSRSCSVGATPGLTKTVQEVSIDKHIKILDSPGVVIAKDDSSTTLALRNAVKVETLKDVITPAEAIIQRANHTQLCMHYTIPEFSSCQELLYLLAKRMGKYKKGGIPNVEEGARRLINDWNRGYIKYYIHPPQVFAPDVYISTCYVSEMSKAFDISLLEEKMELDKAQELFPGNGVEVKGSNPTDGVISDDPTDGVISDCDDKDQMEDETSIKPKQVTFDDKDQMEDEEITIKPKRVTFCVEDDKEEGMDLEEKTDIIKEAKKVAPSYKQVDLSKQQKNKVLKKNFKNMQKKRKRANKAANALSDSMDSALTL